MPDDTTVLEPIARLNRDIRAAALTLGDDEARFLVDAYYIMQEDRKRTYAQQRTLDEDEEPNLVIQWLAAQAESLENQIKNSLDIYTKNHVMGSYMRGVFGIGPVISAGLLAHIYMGKWCAICHGRSPEKCEKRQNDKRLKFSKHEYFEEISCPTAGHIWQFAGIAGDGQRPWLKGEKRPFNAKLKTLQWKVGQSFMKFSNDPKCIYGHHYREQKDVYIYKNDEGVYQPRALIDATKVDRSTAAWSWYNGCYPAGTSNLHEKIGEGLPAEKKVAAKQAYLAKVKLPPGKGLPMLPPGHIDARARRWAVKIFISHLHAEWYERVFNEPAPAPFPIAVLGHVHII